MQRRVLETDLTDTYTFTDSRFVEVLVRCCRVWLDKSTLDPEAVALAERVILVQKTSYSPASFLFDLSICVLLLNMFTQFRAAQSVYSD
jgi:hypothetical protein